MSTAQGTQLPTGPDDFEIMQFRVADAHYHWSMWTELFVGESSKADLLNKVASQFFLTVRLVLLRDVLLSLFKLNDKVNVPVKGGGLRDNLSFKWMIQDTRLAYCPTSQQAASIEALYTSFAKILQPLESLRHWVLAHDDRQAARNPEIVPPLQVKLVSDAVETAVLLAEAIGSVRRPNDDFLYRETIATGGADELIHALDEYRCYLEVDRRQFDNTLLESPARSPS